LKQFDGRGGERGNQYTGGKSNGTDTFGKTQSQVAKEAGMSKRQQVTAVRVANVNETEFESEMAGPAPPTLTELARRLSPVTGYFSNVRRLPGR
jgi:hypothetical protein